MCDNAINFILIHLVWFHEWIVLIIEKDFKGNPWDCYRNPHGLNAVILESIVHGGNAVTDPEFSRGGGANPRVGRGEGDIRFCQIFPKTAWKWKFSQKLHENERIWIGGQARPKFYYVDPPLEWQHMTSVCTRQYLQSSDCRKLDMMIQVLFGHWLENLIDKIFLSSQ